MAKSPPPSQIREGSVRAEVYNEGLVCMLCDQESVAEITRVYELDEHELFE